MEYDAAAAAAGEGDSGIPAGAALTAMATALLEGDDSALATARAGLTEAVGGQGFTDALAVAAIFNAIDRIADGAGIELDDWKEDAISEFDHLPARSTG